MHHDVLYQYIMSPKFLLASKDQPVMFAIKIFMNNIINIHT